MKSEWADYATVHWTDPGTEWNWCAQANLHLKKKKVHAGNEWLNLLPKTLEARKKPPAQQCLEFHQVSIQFMLVHASMPTASYTHVHATFHVAITHQCPEYHLQNHLNCPAVISVLQWTKAQLIGKLLFSISELALWLSSVLLLKMMYTTSNTCQQNAVTYFDGLLSS